MEAFLKLYEILQFIPCDSEEKEEGWDKVALFAIGQTPTHAARLWKEDIAWSSKLGEEQDIAHYTLHALESLDYGRVVKIMKRRRD